MRKYIRLLKTVSSYKKTDNIVKKEQVNIKNTYNLSDKTNKLPYNDFLKIYKWQNPIYLK